MSNENPANGPDWSTIDLTADPHIVLGRRTKGGISAVRIDVHENLHDEIRRVCVDAIRRISETERREYEPHAALEEPEQHFILTIGQLSDLAGSINSEPEATGDRRNLAVGVAEEEPPQEAPALINCLSNPIAHELIERAEFASFAPFFYAVCWQQPDASWVSFLRKTNPQQFFKAGRVWCQYATTLKRIETQPTFAFDPHFDVVVRGSELISFSASALNFLFTDIRLAQTGVPAQVAKIAEAISGKVAMSERSIEALVNAGTKKKSVATQIYGLSARLQELQDSGGLTAERFREIASGEDDALQLLGPDDQLDFDESGASIFLDVIEGRYFEDDWTGSPRRADRFSKRRVESTG